MTGYAWNGANYDFLTVAYDAAGTEAPLEMLAACHGRRGLQGRTRLHARNLTRLTDLPITYWDERLSTVAAERALLEADTSRKRRSEVIDHVAAGYILQGALDRLGYLMREKQA